MTNQNKPELPLWEVMRTAYDQSQVPPERLQEPEPDCFDLTDRYGYAAEIRALVDEVLPQELPYKIDSESSKADFYTAGFVRAKIELRQHLLNEAERAERVEQAE